MVQTSRRDVPATAAGTGLAWPALCPRKQTERVRSGAVIQSSHPAVAELAVDAEGFGQVVLGGEGLHEVAVAAFPERGEAGELAAGPGRVHSR
jgi:hypothetical protein